MSTVENEPPRLYAAREPIFPRRVQGKFRNLKWVLMAITLGIYYITPWIRWDRGPGLPDQAVLVDMAGRRFFFLWIEIWPQEFYYVAGLLIMAGLGLFLVTTSVGRAWCGYACPQTVWTDLFILVERWIEGDRNARIRLYNQPWDARKARLRVTKWTLWLLIGLLTGGAWVFYFADAPTLTHDFWTGQAAPNAHCEVAVDGQVVVQTELPEILDDDEVSGYVYILGSLSTDPQIAELRAAGCLDIRSETGSGGSRARPALARLVREIQGGDTLVVVRIDRLARSLSHLLEVIEAVEARGAPAERVAGECADARGCARGAGCAALRPTWHP